jgi:serine protease DegQ
MNPLSELSNALAEAVENAGRSTLLVNGRRRFPASGIAIAPDLILTADHVIEWDEDIPVILPDGAQESARLAGRDQTSDIAVLKLKEPVAVPSVPAPQDARIGQLVLALGRPTPQGIQASLGIVTSSGGPLRTHRGGQLESYLTTDAIPYPGFSGGPLIDVAGQVLGLNTSGLTRGASLAIPASIAWKIAAHLAEHGHLRRGYLGIRSQPVELPASSQEALGRGQKIGLLLVGIETGSPAAQGGMMVGDILVGIAGSPLEDPEELSGRLSPDLVGKPVIVELLRGGMQTTVDVTIGER